MKKLLVAAAISILAAGTAQAATAITSFSGGTLFPSFGGDDTVGFVFTTNSAISVTALGWFGTGGAVNGSHQIGIWTSGGTLLGSATVSPGAVDGTNVRYIGITPIALASGQQYFIGGRDLSDDGDSYSTSVSNLVTDAAITFNGSAASAGGAGFAFPGSINSISTGGRFGANFQFSLAAVPEPQSWALMIVGFGLVGGAMRRRATAVALG
ncbi:PEPxxWA-CTERM sorting domain-containing protein [Sandarakinorhabdus sp. DWP1-3-1]|uniref:PEPxxWA-CTERM sorting domain-containing protein n=1 Tax=Sandarakinorhabdus sp. DWP1-3-1 TaxID=2804627 RepID=UPI003CE9F590